MTQHQLVLEFHERFAVPVATAPRQLDRDEFRFRFGFMEEELLEFAAAYQDSDLVKQVDALLDLAYVVHGTALMMGVPWERAFDIVHSANMRKMSVRELRAVGFDVPNARHDTDVKKPPGWVGPEAELTQLLREHGGTL